MVNPFQEVNWHPDTAARRSFAWSLMVGFPCIAVVFLLVGYFAGRGWNVSFALKLGGIGAAAGAVFYALPVLARPFYVVWYALACCIGFVVGNVVLSLIYYVLVTGIGLGKRIVGGRGLCKAPDPRAKSYWIDAGPPPEPKRYYSQY